MKYSGSLESVEEQRKAIDVAEGFPRSPTHVGAACRHLVPQTFSPGAFGWTETVAQVTMDEKNVPFIDIPSDIAQRQSGKTVRVDGKNVVIVDEKTLKAEEERERREREQKSADDARLVASENVKEIEK